MNTFEKILGEAERSREEAEELVSQVNAGIAHIPSYMSRERALEVLNGCIGDYNTIIRRLGGRNRTERA